MSFDIDGNLWEKMVLSSKLVQTSRKYKASNNGDATRPYVVVRTPRNWAENPLIEKATRLNVFFGPSGHRKPSFLVLLKRLFFFSYKTFFFAKFFDTVLPRFNSFILRGFFLYNFFSN